MLKSFGAPTPVPVEITKVSIASKAKMSPVVTYPGVR